MAFLGSSSWKKLKRVGMDIMTVADGFKNVRIC